MAPLCHSECLRVDGCLIDVDPVVVDQLHLRGARRRRLESLTLRSSFRV